MWHTIVISHYFPAEHSACHDIPTYFGPLTGGRIYDRILLRNSEKPWTLQMFGNGWFSACSFFPVVCAENLCLLNAHSKWLILARSMVAYNWHLNIELLSRLFLLLCWLKMCDLILYRLPLTMVIATASRNSVQKFHPQRQHHETLLQLYVDIIIIISISGHVM